MNRVVAILILAVFTAAVSGVHEASPAARDEPAQPDDAQREKIARSLKELKIDGPVRIERRDGQKIDGRLLGFTPDTISVLLVKGKVVGTQTIPIADVKKVSKPPHKVRRVVLITVGVLLGACAAAIASYDQGSGPEAPALPSDIPPSPVDGLPSMP